MHTSVLGPEQVAKLDTLPVFEPEHALVLRVPHVLRPHLLELGIQLLRGGMVRSGMCCASLGDGE